MIWKKQGIYRLTAFPPWPPGVWFKQALCFLGKCTKCLHCNIPRRCSAVGCSRRTPLLFLPPGRTVQKARKHEENAGSYNLPKLSTYWACSDGRVLMFCDVLPLVFCSPGLLRWGQTLQVVLGQHNAHCVRGGGHLEFLRHFEFARIYLECLYTYQELVCFQNLFDLFPSSQFMVLTIAFFLL